MEELWEKVKVFLVKLSHFKKRSLLQRYAFALLLVVAVGVLKMYFYVFFGDSSAFLLVSFVVAASAWYGGLGPGIFATFLSAGIVHFLYFPPHLEFQAFLANSIMFFLFLIEGFLISIASEARFEVENQKDEFVGFVAHELKNPLTTIAAYAQLLTTKAQESKKIKFAEYGKMLTTQSNRMIALINNFLDIAKIEVGNFSYQHVPFRIADVLNDAITHQRIATPYRKIILFSASQKILRGDPYRIEQVITNLLTNAVKYSPQAGVIIVRLKENKKEIRISVQDFGLGIAPNQQKKIFNKYYQIHKSNHTIIEGGGIGLYIAQRIVHHYKGRLWVKSTLGKGSEFCFTLPL